ncbi:hypothetical protein GCM10027452_38700 [Micromonospora halotolerans]
MPGTRSSGLLALGGIALAAVLTVVGHLEVNDNLNPWSLTVSDFAVSDRGGVIDTAMAVLAAATLVLLPALRRAAPMATRFVQQLSPEEVTAAIRLVDELPKLKEHLTSDVLPILATLDRVGPDLHDLLAVTRDLKLAVAGIPGLGMLRRRGERLTDEPVD